MNDGGAGFVAAIGLVRDFRGGAGNPRALPVLLHSTIDSGNDDNPFGHVYNPSEMRSP